MIRYLVRLCVVLCAVCMAAFVQACAQESIWQLRQERLDQAKEHYEAGKRLIDQGNYAAANVEFNKVDLLLQEAQTLSQPSPSLSVPVQPSEEGLSETERKNVENALSYYISELKKETSNPDYYYNLGVEYLKNGQFAQAEEAFKLVVNLNPMDKNACYNLGILYENYLGNKTKAMKYYRQYLNISPDAPDAHTVQSWIDAIKEGMNR